MSTRPNWSTVVSMSCLASSRREMSVRWSTAFPPMASTARTAACPAGSLRSAMTTCAPALARATAMVLPIPLPAPVTTPTLPSKLTIDSPPLQLAGTILPSATSDFLPRRSAGIVCGGFDTYSRAITRHIGKHIPGNPTSLLDLQIEDCQLVKGSSRSKRLTRSLLT